MLEVERLDDEDDEVVTQRFTLRGRILEEEYRIRSRYGQLQLDRGDITGIERIAGRRGCYVPGRDG